MYSLAKQGKMAQCLLEISENHFEVNGSCDVFPQDGFDH